MDTLGDILIKRVLGAILLIFTIALLNGNFYFVSNITGITILNANDIPLLGITLLAIAMTIIFTFVELVGGFTYRAIFNK